MTSCGRGRDSATRESFGRGSGGTIFIRSSKLSLFFPKICPFWRVFCFPALLKDLAPNVQALGLLASLMSWRSFWKLHSVTGQFCFANPDYDKEYFLKFFFFFPKKSQCYLPDSYGDPQAEQNTVMVRQKLEWKLDLRRWRDRAQKDHRSLSRLVRVVCGDPSSKEKKKNNNTRKPALIVRSLSPSSSTNQRVLRSLFPRPDVAAVLHFAVIVYVDVQL